MRRLCLFLVVLFCIGLTQEASAVYPEDMRDHPRLFLRNAAPDPDDWQDSLIARATGTHDEMYADFKAYIDARISQGQYTLGDGNYAAGAAICWFIENDSTYFKYAVDRITYISRTGGGAYFVGDSSGDFGHARGALLAYDWLYASVLACENPNYSRARWDSVGVTIGAWLDSHPTQGLTRAGYIPVACNIMPLIAIYGDKTAGDVFYAANHVVDFAKHLEKATYTDTEVGPARGWLTNLDIVSDGGHYGYSGVRYSTVLGAQEAIRSSGGPTYYATSSFLLGTTDFWINRVRSDGSVSRTIGKYNPTQNSITTFCAVTANSEVYADSVAQWYSDKVFDGFVAGEHSSTHTDVDEAQIWLWLVYYVHGRRAVEPIDTRFVDRKMGMVLARDNWTMTDFPHNSALDNSTVVYMAYHPMRADLTSTAGSGHLYISRGKDALLNHSGPWAHDNDLHYNFYYTQGYAWNTILIRDDEPLGSVPLGSGGSTCITNAPEPVPLHGGQQRSVYDCEDSLNTYFGSDGAYAYKGHVAQFADTSGILYCRGNLTQAYTYNCTNSRASKVEREVTWYRPNVFVVRDRVDRTNSNYAVRSRWHFVERPALVGNTSCGCLKQLGTDTGGVFKMPGTRRYKIDRGNSSMYMIICSPRMYSGWVTLTGGPNVDGVYWKQDWEPGSAALCSGSYSAGKSSYEFYIDGKNYPPSDPAANRFDTYGNEASDWTMEVEFPVGATADNSLEGLYVFVVGADDQAAANATTYVKKGVRFVHVTQADTTWTFEYARYGAFTSARKEY